jgi:hypothetical protein
MSIIVKSLSYDVVKKMTQSATPGLNWFKLDNMISQCDLELFLEKENLISHWGWKSVCGMETTQTGLRAWNVWQWKVWSQCSNLPFHVQQSESWGCIWILALSSSALHIIRLQYLKFTVLHSFCKNQIGLEGLLHWPLVLQSHTLQHVDYLLM